ncbi:hypothetical protein ACTXT7_012140 [Hymenolepis weldensis]
MFDSENESNLGEEDRMRERAGKSADRKQLAEWPNRRNRPTGVGEELRCVIEKKERWGQNRGRLHQGIYR